MKHWELVICVFYLVLVNSTAFRITYLIKDTQLWEYLLQPLKKRWTEEAVQEDGHPGQRKEGRKERELNASFTFILCFLAGTRWKVLPSGKFPSLWNQQTKLNPLKTWAKINPTPVRFSLGIFYSIRQS